MKRISFFCLAGLFLLFYFSCANTSSGGMVPSTEPDTIPQPEEPSIPEDQKIKISLENLMSKSQIASTGNAGFDSIQLKKSGISDYKGITSIIDTQNPDKTSVDVSFDSAESEVTKKNYALKASLVKSFKDVLYSAGLESIDASNITVSINSEYQGAVATIAGLQARSEFTFNASTPTISIELVGDFTGYIDLASITSLPVKKAEKMASISADYLISDKPYEVSFYTNEIFAFDTRANALRAMVAESFIPSLSDIGIKTDLDLKNTPVSESNGIASIQLTLTSQSTQVSLQLEGYPTQRTQTVTLEFSNEYGAFSGVQQIQQSQITLSFLKPELTKAMIIGDDAWAISGGSTPGGTRKIAVGEETAISVGTVNDSIVAKIKANPDNTHYSYTGIGAFTKDENNNKVTFPVILTKKDGYLFYTGEPTHQVDFSYTFQSGELTVNDEDFADTLEALKDQNNLDALADKDGNITVQITGDIKNDEAGNTEPFEVSGGTAEKPLHLTFKAPADTEVSVSGGDILTSLVVSGEGTTVTVGKGITISGGLSSTGGGVIVKDGGHFILDGGTISGNHSSGDTLAFGGAGVNVIGHFLYNSNGTLKTTGNNGFDQLYNDSSKTYPPAKFTMKSGLITGNSGIRGGGVYVVGATFIMEGGTISDNTANMGGGIYIRGEGQPTLVTLTGGIVENNFATHEAVNGVTTRDVLARGYGGGLNISGGRGVYTTVNIEDGCTIRNNDATKTGTEIAFYDNLMKINMTGGEVYHDGATTIETKAGETYSYEADKATGTYHNGGTKVVTEDNKFLITNSVYWNGSSHSAFTFSGGTIQDKEATTASPLINLFKSRSGT